MCCIQLKNLYLQVTVYTSYNGLVVWEGHRGGCCQSGRTRIGQKIPYLHLGPTYVDLVLRCAWFSCIKFKISHMTYSVLNILGMGSVEREGKWGWAIPGHRSGDFEELATVCLK
jgi:hypothetical protein